ncbi:hypothetical protein H8702_12660 [Massilimaliae timonensis]|uniref:Uncharacterized protein n=1 Tax=Massiliimalia timonensis TaxID=1987501 RepID=A0A8J6PH21_9FIRM|nr:hypothetical protein [Massiliimalia timonensis]MBC8611942.1 hypothetical protein [Massiliimalia timonensis]
MEKTAIARCRMQTIYKKARQAVPSMGDACCFLYSLGEPSILTKIGHTDDNETSLVKALF